MVDLKQWAIDYVRHKDAFQKKIVDIVSNDHVKIKYKDKEELVLICPELSDSFAKLEKNLYVSVFTLNKKTNFNELLQRWHSLTRYEKLTIYFVNPSSSTETKWIIRPHLHNKIADDDSLKTGLESMYSMVEEYKG